jgi:hypothetical protein
MRQRKPAWAWRRRPKPVSHRPAAACAASASDSWKKSGLPLIIAFAEGIQVGRMAVVREHHHLHVAGPPSGSASNRGHGSEPAERNGRDQLIEPGGSRFGGQKPVWQRGINQSIRLRVPDR